MEATWRLLQQDAPDDYVVFTGEGFSIQEFLGLAFERLDLDWQQHVGVDARYYRPAEVDHLECDPSKGCQILQWEARTNVRSLVAMMFDADLKLAQREMVLRDARHAETPQSYCP